MRAATLQVVWHDKKPVFSVDFHPTMDRLATGGADNAVQIWRVVRNEPSKIVDVDAESKEKEKDKQPIQIEFRAALKRHDKSVNVVRFSPNGKFLASCGDDGTVIIWKQEPDTPVPGPRFGDQSDVLDKEVWSTEAVLYRGRSEDVYDVSWSPDSAFLACVSVDSFAVVWHIETRSIVQRWNDHTHYCQGVAWDPRGYYLATQSADRSVRIYSLGSEVAKNPNFGSPSSKKRKSAVAKAAAKCVHTIQRLDETAIQVPTQDVSASTSESTSKAKAKAKKNARIFADETTPTFFRRLCWSVDGTLLFTPTGQYVTVDANNASESVCVNTTYVFHRSAFSTPILHLPEAEEPSVVVKCAPLLFQSRKMKDTQDKKIENGNENELSQKGKEQEQDKGDSTTATATATLSLPYVMVFAVGTQNTVYLYDTESMCAIAILKDYHYAQISDIAWAPDCSLLAISSQDGYCTIVEFSENELGIPLNVSDYPESMGVGVSYRSSLHSKVAVSGSGSVKNKSVQSVEQSSVQSIEQSVQSSVVDLTEDEQQTVAVSPSKKRRVELVSVTSETPAQPTQPLPSTTAAAAAAVTTLVPRRVQLQPVTQSAPSPTPSPALVPSQAAQAPQTGVAE